MRLGDDGYSVTNAVSIQADAQPARDYKVVDSANSQELNRVVDVKGVREEIAKNDMGTTFLLNEGGLYLIRRPGVEMVKKFRELAYAN
jgi:hypothetical protein